MFVGHANIFAKEFYKVPLKPGFFSAFRAGVSKVHTCMLPQSASYSCSSYSVDYKHGKGGYHWRIWLFVWAWLVERRSTEILKRCAIDAGYA